MASREVFTFIRYWSSSRWNNCDDTPCPLTEELDQFMAFVDTSSTFDDYGIEQCFMSCN